MEQPERKWVSEQKEEEDEEEVVGLQDRRSRHVHGENEYIRSASSIERDQGTPEIKSDGDGVPYFSIQNQMVKKSYEEQSRSTNKNTEIDKGGVDLDVEGVLEKQETYDLICPHCQSCITKKVILRRREPKMPQHVEDQSGSADDIGSIGDPEPPKTDVFRCSACLRFFTCLGRDCFSVFRGKPKTDADTSAVQQGSGEEEPWTSIHVGAPIAPEVGEWEILKSVVYGGLAESITSLGIVSSAAGAAAATLNIMGLALANLIGGLFVIAHNLLQLRNDSSGGGYQETLGPRDKFNLHVVTVIFGAIPPIVYGFSFRDSDDKDLKLAVVAASSLVCITLLATAKAHVHNPPKRYFKTILYYVAVGFMASAVSYVVGGLFDRLLKYLGLFESSSAANASIQETKSGY